MLVESGLVEQRYKAVMEVVHGLANDAAAPSHVGLRRYAPEAWPAWPTARRSPSRVLTSWHWD